MAKSFFLALIFSFVLGSTASAFTPVADRIEGMGGKTSTVWQPMVAEKGDTIWTACLGFPWAKCLSEIVLDANPDKFPKHVTKESDFYIQHGVVYLIPVQASTSPVSPESVSGPEDLDILSTFRTEVDSRLGNLEYRIDGIDKAGVATWQKAQDAARTAEAAQAKAAEVAADVGYLRNWLYILAISIAALAVLMVVGWLVTGKSFSGVRNALGRFDERLTGVEKAVHYAVSVSETGRLVGFKHSQEEIDELDDGVEIILTPECADGKVRECRLIKRIKLVKGERRHYVEMPDIMDQKNNPLLAIVGNIQARVAKAIDGETITGQVIETVPAVKFKRSA